MLLVKLKKCVMCKKVGFIVLICCFWIVGFSQGFTNINAGLTGTHWGDVAWGDYNRDGNLDVIVTGLDADGVGKTTIYKNNGGDSFSALQGLIIPGSFVGDVAWGDYDADGDLDILIAGYTDGAEITKIYKNGGDDTFGETSISFPVLTDGSTNFIDYNNDGYVDILLSGYDGANYIAVLYKNNGDATFSDSGIFLPGAIKSSYEWGDYDNDGDMDIFITGLGGDGNLFSKLFENTGNDVFVETLNDFVGAWLGDMAWGDYDNDGDLDILLSGYTFSTERITKLYKNDGEGNFDEVLFTGLVGVSHSSTVWGDYDNDGDLDVFIAGTYEGSGSWVRVTDVFVNNGDDTFSALGLTFSADAYWGESAWGDYNNDGRLDLICSGYDDAGGSHTFIYRNENSNTNTVPSPPENLTAEVTDNNVLLSWDAAIDNETPSAGLSYNAYIRNEIGDVIWNSMTLDDGYRLLPSLGNAQQNIQWIINELPVGTYFCGVQAIDHIYAGSVFSDEVQFDITFVGVDGGVVANKDFTNLSNYPNPFSQSTTIKYNLLEAGFVQIDIFDINGKLVNSLVKENRKAGLHADIWSGNSSLSGIYYYVLKVNDVFVSKQKCLLLK